MAPTRKEPPKLPPHAQPIKLPPAIDTKPWGPDSEATKITKAELASNAANPQAAGANGSYFTGDFRGQNADPTIAPDPSKDWASAFFGALGLPDDVMKQVTQTLRDHAQNPTLAQALATQYIRSTGWYQIHYPGALEGIAKGVIKDESQYVDYMNQLNVLSRQYNGRDISGDEIKGYLQAGYDPSYVSKLYGGQAWAAANRNDVNYTLGAFGDGQPSQTDMTALGNENSGLDSAVGQKLQTQLQQATQRLHAIFRGTLATPSLTLGANGLQAPSLAGAKQPNDLGT